MSNRKFKMTVCNEDGTEYNPPMHPEFEQYLNEHICQYGIGHKCMYCSDCPNGEYFKWPENKIHIRDKQRELLKKYMEEHNPSNLGLAGISCVFGNIHKLEVKHHA